MKPRGGEAAGEPRNGRARGVFECERLLTDSRRRFALPLSATCVAVAMQPLCYQHRSAAEEKSGYVELWA